MTAKNPSEQTTPSIYPEGTQRRLLKGLGANSLGQVVLFAERVFLAPLFLMAWGADIYGEWLLLSSFVAYLALTDMGGQSYIVNRMTQAYARQDVLTFRKVLHTGLAVFLIAPAAVFVVFLAVVLLVPPGSFLPIAQTDQQTAVWVLAILAFQFVFSLPQGILLGIYRAVGLLSRGVMLNTLILLLQLVFIATGLWLGGGMVLIAVLYILPFLLVALVALRDLDRRFPKFHLLSLEEADYSTGRTFVKPSLHFLSIQLTNVFSIQGMVLIVGFLFTPVQVVMFSTSRTMANAMKQILLLVIYSTEPEVTRLDAQQDMSRLLVLFRLILRSTLGAAAVLVAVFHFFGADIYHLWLGERVPFQQTLMDLFLIYVLVLVFWNASSTILMTTNRHHTLAKVLLAASVLAVLLGYFGGQYLGLQGVVVGMIAGDLLLPCWAIPYLVGRYQRQFSPWFFLGEVAPIVAGLMSVILLPWSAPVVGLVLLLWWARSVHAARIL